MTDFRLNLSLRESQKNWKIAQTFKNYQTDSMICFNKESKRQISDPAIGIDLKRKFCIGYIRTPDLRIRVWNQKKFWWFPWYIGQNQRCYSSAISCSDPVPSAKWKMESSIDSSSKTFPRCCRNRIWKTVEKWSQVWSILLARSTTGMCF